MPRKKVAGIESPSRKNISLTLQNEENEDKCNCGTVRKKKQCVPRSRKKKVFGSLIVDAPFQPEEKTESPVVLSSKKPRIKISTIKSPRNSKTKKLLTERNMNVNNAKSNTTVKKKKICVRRSSGKKEQTGSPSVVVVDPFKFVASPASCSKRPRKKVITTKSPRNSQKKKLSAERNVNEKNKKSDCIVKKMKNCGMCQRSGIIEVAGPSSVVSALQYVEEIASPTASSSKSPRRKVLKTKSARNKVLKTKSPRTKVLKNKSPRTSRKRKLPTKKSDHEESDSNMKKEKHCDLQSEDRENDVSLVVNISTASDVVYLKEIGSTAASSAEQRDHENNEERDSNMKKEKHCDLQSGDTEDVPFVVNVSSAEVVALAEETRSTTASSANSKSNYEEVREMKCMICLELTESSMFIVMSCDHSFHSLCLQTWFQVKKSCPVCNPEISANDDALNNSGIGDTDESNDMNRHVNLVNYVNKNHNELHHMDKTVNGLKKLNEDINEFLMRCVICMGTSRSVPFDGSPDQFSDFELMPCGHNVHAVCAQTSSGEKKACPVCMENSRIEDEDIYEFPEEVRCVICLDTVESPNFEYISCCHSFHQQCIETWFTVRRGEICPVCMVSTSSNAVEDEAVYGFLENVKCTICMDIEESSEFRRLSCRHNFHTMCAQTWFQENSYCPTCMKNVSLDSTETDDEEDVRCVICVDTEESSVFEFLSCCHSFHAVCIQSWLKKGKSCPICNTRILDTSNTVENIGCAASCN